MKKLMLATVLSSLAILTACQNISAHSQSTKATWEQKMTAQSQTEQWELLYGVTAYLLYNGSTTYIQ